MDVSPKQGASRRTEPEPPSEYVGALRGAAPAKAPESRLNPSRDSARTHASDGAQKNGASSTKAIVVGAATAAVVSSLTAATMMLWTSGGNRSDDAARLTFYTNRDQSGGRGTGGEDFAPQRDPSLPPAENSQQLLQRADTYLRSGKPEEARVVLEQAARGGSGVAALTLGAMYDPGRVSQFANLGIKPDPTVARVWYERAKDLGVAEANDRLAELAAR